MGQSTKETLRTIVVVALLTAGYVGLNYLGERGRESLPGVPVAAAAPGFELRSVGKDEAVSLEALQGKVVLMVFWATWCRPCVAEIPALKRLQTELGPQGLQVVGVNQEPEVPDQVGAFVQRQALNYPVVIDDGRISRTWRVSGLPSMALIDRNGMVRWKKMGAASYRTLESKISELL